MTAIEAASYLPPLVAIAIVVRRRIQKVKRVFVPDFQRGLRFVRGTFKRELDPGSYIIASVKEQIELVDMRPQPLFFDRIYYRDAWRNDAVVTLYAELSVEKPHLASTALKNQIDDSMPIVRDKMREVLAKSISDETSEFRAKTSQQITDAVNEALRPTGMKIGAVEILEFWSRPIPLPTTGIAQ